MSEQSNSERPPSVVTGVTWYSPDEWSIIPDHVADPETFDYPKRGQSRVLTHFKNSEKFGVWPDNCESNTLGQFTM